MSHHLKQMDGTWGAFRYGTLFLALALMASVCYSREPEPTPQAPNPTPQPTGEPYTETALGLNMSMVWIPAGSFHMGSPDSESGRNNDEGPVRTVSLDGFWMGATEVTQAQFEAVMEANPSGFRGANRPVERVSWDDAMAFCRRLSERTGQTYTLPTEAQWEYACRAGTTTPFHFGATISTDQANYDGNYTYGSGVKGVYRMYTVPVGSFNPNAWGLYDMHGNVLEWCLDWYDKDFYGTAAASAKNPVNNNATSYRLLRGGSWDDLPRYCRSALRVRYSPTGTNHRNGFRVVAAPGVES